MLPTPALAETAAAGPTVLSLPTEPLQHREPFRVDVGAGAAPIDYVRLVIRDGATVLHRRTDYTAPYHFSTSRVPLPEKVLQHEVVVRDLDGRETRRVFDRQIDLVPTMRLELSDYPIHDGTFVTISPGENSQVPPTLESRPTLWIDGAPARLVDARPLHHPGTGTLVRARIDLGRTVNGSHTIGVGDARRPLVTYALLVRRPGYDLRWSVPRTPGLSRQPAVVGVRGAPGERIELRQDTGRANNPPLRTGVAGADGLVLFTVRPEQSITLYARSLTFAERSTPRFALPVAASLTLRASQARPGAPVVLSGVATPCQRRRVQVDVVTGTATRPLIATETSCTGRPGPTWSVAKRLPPGTYRLRAAVATLAATPSFAVGRSSVVTVVVR